MKIIGVACSGRAQSASAELVREILKGAEAAGAETVYFNIGRGNLRGCMGCNTCKGPEAGFCVINDILKDYFKELPDADAVVMGCGNFMSFPQGEAWAFMNRHFCLFRNIRDGLKIPAGKKFLGVFAQGAPDNPQYRGYYDIFTNYFKDWGFEIVKPYPVTNSVVKDEMRTACFELGRKLGAGETV